MKRSLQNKLCHKLRETLYIPIEPILHLFWMKNKAFSFKNRCQLCSRYILEAKAWLCCSEPSGPRTCFRALRLLLPRGARDMISIDVLIRFDTFWMCFDAFCCRLWVHESLNKETLFIFDWDDTVLPSSWARLASCEILEMSTTSKCLRWNREVDVD